MVLIAEKLMVPSNVVWIDPRDGDRRHRAVVAGVQRVALGAGVVPTEVRADDSPRVAVVVRLVDDVTGVVHSARIRRVEGDRREVHVPRGVRARGAILVEAQWRRVEP